MRACVPVCVRVRNHVRARVWSTVHNDSRLKSFGRRWETGIIGELFTVHEYPDNGGAR